MPLLSHRNHAATGGLHQMGSLLSGDVCSHGLPVPLGHVPARELPVRSELGVSMEVDGHGRSIG